MCPESQPDVEIKAIQALEDKLGELPPRVERIRSLESRIDPLSHYEAFENIDFIMKSIGELDYPGYPAVNVLWRNGQIDDERREEAKRYIYSISSWLDGKNVEEAKIERQECSRLLDKVYTVLGEMSDHKRWLAMSLSKTLKEHAYTPWDFIGEYGDEDFIKAVYVAVIGREPSPDDLKFRMEELKTIKSREEFFLDVFNAEEHKMGHLHGVAGILKSSK